MQRRISRLIVWAVVAATLGLIAGTHSAQAGPVAHWRFEPGQFLQDSSANGYTLQAGGAVSSPDVAPAASGTGSAWFDGLNDFLRTVGAVDLSPHRNLKVSYWQRVQNPTTQVGLIYEQSTDFNNHPGAILASTMDGAPEPNPPQPRGGASLRNASGWNIDLFPHGQVDGGNPNGVWDFMEIEYSLSTGTNFAAANAGAAAANIVKVYRNGVLQPDATGWGQHSTAVPSAFYNDVMYLGSRAGSASFFKGNIDELKIEEISGVEYFPGPGGTNRPGSPAWLAADGDLNTISHFTTGYTFGSTHGPQRFGISFDADTVDGIRVNKPIDIDGTGDGPDVVDLKIFATTDRGPLASRTWVPVENLTNGYDGANMMSAGSVNPNGTVTADAHDSTLDAAGYYALSFEPIPGATGLAVEFFPNPYELGPGRSEANHYGVREAQPIFGSAAQLRAEVPVTGIDVFDAATQLIDLSRPPAQGHPPADAIDDNPLTWTSLTPSYNQTAVIAALDLGGLEWVGRLRVGKVTVDIDGVGEPVDTMDLEILFTTDTGPLNQRVYQPVSGLSNGYLGNELINATVYPNGTIDNDEHDPATDGIWWTVSFGALRATALGIRIGRDPNDPEPWIHYTAYEFQVFEAVPEPSGLVLLAVGLVALLACARRRRKT